MNPTTTGIASLVVLSVTACVDKQPPVAQAGVDVGASSVCAVSISGGDTKTFATTQSCPQCSVENEGGAVDGRSSTSAMMEFTATSEEASLAFRAIAQTGVVFPAGSPAGMVLSFPEAVIYNTKIVVSTYNTGELQEQFLISNDTVGVRGSNLQRASFRTSAAFDAVELEISVAEVTTINDQGSPIGHAAVDVHEVCGG